MAGSGLHLPRLETRGTGRGAGGVRRPGRGVGRRGPSRVSLCGVSVRTDGRRLPRAVARITVIQRHEGRRIPL